MLCIGPDGKLCHDGNTQLGRSFFKKAASKVVTAVKSGVRTAATLTPTYIAAKVAQAGAQAIRQKFAVAAINRKIALAKKQQELEQARASGAPVPEEAAAYDAGAPSSDQYPAYNEPVYDQPSPPVPMTATAPSPMAMPGSAQEEQQEAGSPAYGTMPISPEEFFGPAPEYMSQDEEGSAAPESSVTDGSVGAYIIDRASPAEHVKVAKRLPLYRPPAHGRIRANVSKALRSKMNPRTWASALGGG